jgi:GTP-binding protein
MFIGYQPFKGEVDKSRRGSMISTASGTVTAYSLQNLEPRGIAFVKPVTKIFLHSVMIILPLFSG